MRSSGPHTWYCPRMRPCASVTASMSAEKSKPRSDAALKRRFDVTLTRTPARATPSMRTCELTRTVPWIGFKQNAAAVDGPEQTSNATPIVAVPTSFFMVTPPESEATNGRGNRFVY